ncbi:ABC transporter substrate-binding protein [Candidatus Bipolaricaulota bacterium]
MHCKCVRKALVLILLTSIAVSMLGVVGYSQAPAEGTELVMMVHENWRGWDPRIHTRGALLQVVSLFYNALVRFDENFVLQPELATSWELVGDTSYIFHLRKGVLFHDGVEMTAADVKYTYDSVFNEDLDTATWPGILENLESVEIIDDYTVQFNTKEYFVPFPTYLLLGILPKHYAEPLDTAGNQAEIIINPIGTGPMKMVSFPEPGLMTVERFVDYWEGVPTVSKLTTRTSQDASSRLLAVQAGDADIAWYPPPKKLDDIEADANLGLHASQAFSVIYGWFNHSVWPLNILKVRQALMYAMDMDKVNRIATDNTYTRQAGPVFEDHWAYNPNINFFDQDMDKARELLGEAGFTWNGDIWEYEDGRELTFTYTTDFHWRSEPELEITNQMFAELGVVTDLDIRAWDVVWPNIKEGSLESAMGMGQRVMTADQMMYRQFHSSMQPPNGWNYQWYSNAQVDWLLDQARVTDDQELRKLYYQAVQKIVVDEVAQIFLYRSTRHSVYGADLKDFTWSETGQFRDLVMNTYK